MNILFVHQNFPGQFKHLAPALAQKSGNTVVALTMQAQVAPTWRGVRCVRYAAQRGNTPGVHPWLLDFESKTIRAQAALGAARALRAQGFVPDIIIAHPGWGESLFLKDVWPHARLGIYCEFFYQAQGGDVGFDPEFPSDAEESARLRLKNINNLLHFETADAGLSPTHWQASTFPLPFRERITVVHDGIDTQALVPNPHAAVTLNGQLHLKRGDEIVTFVNRNLEPYRGYHVFMRALPAILRRRPHARILIVGGNDVSYGARPPEGQTWKEMFASEVRHSVSDADWERVHFLGAVPYNQFVALLQLSAVHAYLTYPFVLSWSLLEAMSAGCAVVASDTQPLHEVVLQGQTGRLVPFFNPQALADEVCALLADAPQRLRLGQAARAFVQAHHDLHRICLPRQLEWIQQLAHDRT